MQARRRHSRGIQEKRILQRDVRYRSAVLLFPPAAALLFLGAILTMCTWIETFGKDTVFWQPALRKWFQIVGIAMLVLSIVAGLSAYLLWKSVKTGNARMARKTLTSPALSVAPLSQDAKCSDEISELTETGCPRDNRAYQRSMENKIERLSEPTYHFPPVEIHAHDLEMWDLKCSMKLTDEDIGPDTSVVINDKKDGEAFSDEGNQAAPVAIPAEEFHENRQSNKDDDKEEELTIDHTEVVDVEEGDHDQGNCELTESLTRSTRSSPPLPPYPELDSEVYEHGCD